MFGLNENTQYYVCQRYVRMNMGINGLYQIVRTEMELPPLGGAVFIFFSKNRQQVKMLKWDGDGFLLYQKRLERGTFALDDRFALGVAGAHLLYSKVAADGIIDMRLTHAAGHTIHLQCHLYHLTHPFFSAAFFSSVFILYLM